MDNNSIFNIINNNMVDCRFIQ